jgi:phytoene dehydrogenase-like protein
MIYDIIVVGGGIAGLTAAAYGGRAGKNVLLLEQSEHLGGLAGSFDHQGFVLDFGIRAFENSGIVKPMLDQLGIDPEFVKSPVSIGIQNDFVKLIDKSSLSEYRQLLNKHFPADGEAISAICAEIEKVMGYMDVLYGIDNPLFLDKMETEYLTRTLLPWLFRYQKNVKKAAKLSDPINDYLGKFTQNRALIDLITQHFFRETPAFFALSYFSLYLDYNYPIGGTRSIIHKMTDYLLGKQVEIRRQAEVVSIDPSRHVVGIQTGEELAYRELIWAADMAGFYERVQTSEALPRKVRLASQTQQALVADKIGCDSVFTTYLMVDAPPQAFGSICGAHSFYTPNERGIADLRLERFDKNQSKEALFASLLEPYFAVTTYEISIPAMRDAALAPAGKTALIVSTLMDYHLVKHIAKEGWYDEFKTFAAQATIHALQDAFPVLRTANIETLTSSPLTIEKFTKNRHGAITGWSFVNHPLPSASGFKDIMKSVKTPFIDIHQAGQWTFSPSGFPVSILTGRVASDKALKRLKKVRHD